MKKLTAVLLTLLFVYTSSAQGHFRIQAGPVFSNLRSEGNIGSFSKLHAGFTAGLSYEMIASKNFSVQPELNFTHLNVSESITNSDLKFDYMQVPVLLKVVNKNRNFSFYLGPQLGFLTKASQKTAGKKSDVKDELTQTDFSGMVGIEYILPASVIINVRFTQGFSNVYKVEFGSANTTRHQILGVTIGYLFGNKK